MEQDFREPAFFSVTCSAHGGGGRGGLDPKLGLYHSIMNTSPSWLRSLTQIYTGLTLKMGEFSYIETGTDGNLMPSQRELFPVHLKILLNFTHITLICCFSVPKQYSHYSLNIK